MKMSVSLFFLLSFSHAFSTEVEPFPSHNKIRKSVRSFIIENNFDEIVRSKIDSHNDEQRKAENRILWESCEVSISRWKIKPGPFVKQVYALFCPTINGSSILKQAKKSGEFPQLVPGKTYIFKLMKSDSVKLITLHLFNDGQEQGLERFRETEWVRGIDR